MILINLLPHREAARKRRKEEFFVHLGFSFVAGALIVGAAYLWYQSMISEQESRNNVLKVAIKKLDAEIKDIASLQAEIDSLRARKQAVEDLQADRNLPVYMLEDLASQLPDGVFLQSIKQSNLSVLVKGTAQSQERVSELLRNLSNNSKWVTKPELIEIVSGTPRGGADKNRISTFTMRVTLVRPSAPEAKKDGTGPAPAAGKVG